MGGLSADIGISSNVPYAPAKNSEKRKIKNFSTPRACFLFVHKIIFFFIQTAQNIKGTCIFGKLYFLKFIHDTLASEEVLMCTKES